MFTSKQISTIKKALQDKEEPEESILEPSKKFNHNLILGTARLQEIYKQVCNTEKSHLTSENKENENIISSKPPFSK